MSASLNTNATRALSQISFSNETNSYSIKIGDAEEVVTRCLGDPRGTITVPEDKKTLLYYGGGKVDLSQGEVSRIILPDDKWPWSIWIALNRDEIISESYVSASYRWELLVDEIIIAQGIWNHGEIECRKHKHGGTSISYPSEPTPFEAYFMKYRDGILTLSSTNGIKRAQLTFHDGKSRGPCLFWHPDGSVWMKGQYDNNIKKGNWARWELNGDLSLIDYPEKNKSIQTQGFMQSCVWPSMYIRQHFPEPLPIGNEVRWDLKIDAHFNKSGVWKKGERIPFVKEIYDSPKSALTIYTDNDKKLMQLSLSKGGLDGECSWWNLDGSKRMDGRYKDNSPVRFRLYKGDHYSTLEFDENEKSYFK